MGFVIDYNLTISNWYLSQHDMENEIGKQFLTEKINDVKAYYNYSIAPGYSGLNLTTKLLINLPDASYLKGFSMNRYSGNIHSPVATHIDDYTKHTNNSIEYTLTANGTEYSINFNTNFTLEFINTAGPNYWSLDALVGNLDLRKRTYEISCVAGPSILPISYFYFNETTLPYTDGISIDSELGRPVQREDMNYTNANSIKIGPAWTTLKFLAMSSSEFYYLVRGETDRITYHYHTSHSLSIVIMDNTKLPIKDAELLIYYQDVLFGTVMSASETYQIATKYTDSQGQVFISNVPYGAYTVAIYYKGHFVQNETASPTLSLNYFISDIPHFPTWVVIFSITNALLVITGLYIYKKNQKRI